MDNLDKMIQIQNIFQMYTLCIYLSLHQTLTQLHIWSNHFFLNLERLFEYCSFAVSALFVGVVVEQKLFGGRVIAPSAVMRDPSGVLFVDEVQNRFAVRDLVDFLIREFPRHIEPVER